MKRLKAVFKGHVQGIGFRETCRRYATHFHLVGTVCNLPDGSVELIAEGPEETLQALLEAIQKKPRGAKIKSVDARYSSAERTLHGFHVIFHL